MNRMVFYICLLLLILPLFSRDTKKDNWPVLKGPYLGQKPPGMEPEIFAPGIISKGYFECMAFFTPDDKEFYYMLWGAPHGVIFFTKEVGHQWIKPQVASFSGKYHGKFSLSPDGNKIVFSSNRPLDGRGEPIDSYYSWIVERTDSGWSEPKNLGPLINLKKSYSAYPSLSENGNLYFFSNREGGVGESDIWMSKFVDGRYTEPENLGKSINTKLNDVDPFIASDESYIIFCRRDDGFGGFDLFISFREADGSWIKAQSMGKSINNGNAAWPYISPNGKYFFFVSDQNRAVDKDCMFWQIYWVSAKIIEEFRHLPPLDSRGGDVIAYCSQPVTGSNTKKEIYTINADGSGNARIIDTNISLNHHAWSPDGTKIVFSRVYPDQNLRSELWVMDADGNNTHYIGVEGFAAKWSPDGSHFLYQSSLRGSSDLFTCGIDGSDVQQLTATAYKETSPVCSPDGTRIAFGSDRDGNYETYVMDTEGSHVQRLTNDPNNDNAPRWSPDGSLIAFHSGPHLGMGNFYYE